MTPEGVGSAADPPDRVRHAQRLVRALVGRHRPHGSRTRAAELIQRLIVARSLECLGSLPEGGLARAM